MLLPILMVAVIVISGLLMRNRHGDKASTASQAQKSAPAGNPQKPALGEKPGEIMKAPELPLPQLDAQQTNPQQNIVPPARNIEPAPPAVTAQPTGQETPIPTAGPAMPDLDAPMHIQRLPPIDPLGAPGGPQGTLHGEPTLAPGVARLEPRIEKSPPDARHEPSRPGLY
jgi:hypothetical protein